MALSKFGHLALHLKILGNDNGEYYYRALNPLTWITIILVFIIFFGYCAFTENKIQDILFEVKFKLW